MDKEEIEKPNRNFFVVSSITLVSICIFFNITGLYIGTTNQNATCYTTKNIISLSQWLILENSVSIVSSFIYIFLLIKIVCRCTEKAWEMLFIFLNWVFSLIFYIIMMIIAIIELVYQFPLCKYETSLICIMVIISVIISLIYICSSKT
jgi:hypothetical protein